VRNCKTTGKGRGSRGCFHTCLRVMALQSGGFFWARVARAFLFVEGTPRLSSSIHQLSVTRVENYFCLLGGRDSPAFCLVAFLGKLNVVALLFRDVDQRVSGQICLTSRHGAKSSMPRIIRNSIGSHARPRQGANYSENAMVSVVLA